MGAPTREQIVQAVRNKLAKDFSNDSVSYCMQVMSVAGFSVDEIRALVKECEPKKPEPETVAPVNGHSTPSDLQTVAEVERHAFEALKQPPAKTVPVESIVPPPDEPVESVVPVRGTFATICIPLIERGIPVTPIRPGTKKAFLPDFPTTATTDLNQVLVWDKQFPNHNAACVARTEDGGVWFFEADSPNVLERIKAETGHDLLAEVPTFRVRSRPGRGHFYFRHNAASIGLGNISQSYVLHADWSVRTNREYVVAPGSIHPDTGKPYEALDWNTPIAEAPQWFLDWLISQKIEKKSGEKEVKLNERGLVPHGSIHGFMLTQAGKLRQMGLNQDEIEPILLRIVHEQCEPPIDDSKVVAMAKSICTYDPGQDHSLILNQQATQAAAPPVPRELLHIAAHDYPKFPEWVLEGTSIYEGFVKPVCAVNERIPYFMWMPTAAMLLNYVGTKVRVPLKSWKPSFYLVLIGEKNKAHKSSSIKDGMKFLEFAGLLSMFSKEIKNAEAKSVVWEAGSPEGLGTDMQRINCKNSILFYDELSVLAQKARIEGSGMHGALLKLYESANFANSVKVKKDAFSIAPDSYVATLITATTDQRFQELWGQFAGDDTGLNDRFTFILQPEQMPNEELEQTVPFHEAALATRKLIDKAVNQGTYQFDFGFDGLEMLKECQKVCGGRTEMRAEKWALFFAIDLNKNVIDNECIERGVALAMYEKAVKKYLEPEEADSKFAGLQQKMVRLLERAEGHVMPLRAFRTQSGERRFGTDMWRKAFAGLASMDVIYHDKKDDTVQLLAQWGGGSNE